MNIVNCVSYNFYVNRVFKRIVCKFFFFLDFYTEVFKNVLKELILFNTVFEVILIERCIVFIFYIF